jgi:hypothetical protein
MDHLGVLYASKDRDRSTPIEWWNMYGFVFSHLHKLAVKVLSQVVNTSSAERCWSTYSFIHNVKRNCLNDNRAESLVYVHYNLRLLTYYCERAKSDRSYITWDNNPEENNLEDGALVLECLEDELLGDDDHQATVVTEMPPPRLPPASQIPSKSVRGGRTTLGRGSRPLVATQDDETPQSSTPIIHRPREKKLEISRGKRTHK